MFRLRGDEIFGDMRPRSESRWPLSQYDARHLDAEDRHYRANDQRLLGRQTDRCRANEVNEGTSARNTNAVGWKGWLGLIFSAARVGGDSGSAQYPRTRSQE